MKIILLILLHYVHTKTTVDLAVIHLTERTKCTTSRS